MYNSILHEKIMCNCACSGLCVLVGAMLYTAEPLRERVSDKMINIEHIKEIMN